MTESIATSIFNKFYDTYKTEGYEGTVILFNLLPIYVEECSEDWGLDYSLRSYRSSDAIEGSKPLFELKDNNTNKIVAITENGSIYTFATKTYKSGGTTWNGDDEYYANYKTDYVSIEKIDEASNFLDLSNLTDEKMKSVAFELVDILSSIH